MRQLLPILCIFLVTSCYNSNNKIDEPSPSSLSNQIVHKKKVVERTTYSMQYLDSWTIDSTDVDFDMDTYFTVDAPIDNGFVTFFIFNTSIDEKVHVDEQIKAHLSKTMKNGTVAYFDSWGKFKGHGALIDGKLLGVWKGEIKIFSHSSDSLSFLVVSEYSKSDGDKFLPGLRLIESSFKLK